MTIGRIGGPMLKENLIRQGVDLSIETDLVYFDVNNMRLGVNTATPNVAMDINGITRFSSNLQINGSNISTYASNSNITLSPHGSGKVVVNYLTSGRIPYNTTGGAITDSANLTFDGTTLSVAGLTLTGNSNIAIGNLLLENNSIVSTNTNGNIVLDPNGTGSVLLETATANTLIYSGTNKELLTNANLTFDGSNLVLSGTANINTLNVSTLSSNATNANINLDPNGTGNVLLDTATANRVIYASTNKELLTNSNLQFDGTTLQIGNITATSNTIGNSNGNINITPTGGYRVVFGATNSVRLPSGDTSQRPTPAESDFRYNNETKLIEFYDGTSWKSLTTDSVVLNLYEAFNGDGSTTVFTLSQSTTSNGIFVTLNGVVQTPGTAYGVSGTALTFTEAPATGDKIDVRFLSDANDLSLSSIVSSTTSVTVTSTLANVNISGSLQMQVNANTTKINNNLSTTAPVTKTNDFTVSDTENFLINNKSGSTCIATLPTASSYPGRQITIKNLQTQLVNSASSNVCPIDSSTPGTAILTNVVGKWAILVSDGTNWVIMATG